MRGPLTACAIAAVVIFIAGAAIQAPAARSAGTSASPLSIVATPAELPLGRSVQITGTLAGAPGTTAGQVIELQSAPYPYQRFSNFAHTVTLADGSFAFAHQRPDRNTRYRAVAIASGVASPVAQVYVDAPAELRARSQGPGQVLLTVVTKHPSNLHWRGTTVWWFLAVRGGHTWKLAGTSKASELRPGVLLGSIIVDPPAKRFLFSACLNPPGEAAMGPPKAHTICAHRDYNVKRIGR